MRCLRPVRTLHVFSYGAGLLGLIVVERVAELEDDVVLVAKSLGRSLQVIIPSDSLCVFSSRTDGACRRGTCRCRINEKERVVKAEDRECLIRSLTFCAVLRRSRHSLHDRVSFVSLWISRGRLKDDQAALGVGRSVVHLAQHACHRRRDTPVHLIPSHVVLVSQCPAFLHTAQVVFNHGAERCSDT